jgi:hypothetical protein
MCVGDTLYFEEHLSDEKIREKYVSSPFRVILLFSALGFSEKTCNIITAFKLIMAMHLSHTVLRPYPIVNRTNHSPK